MQDLYRLKDSNTSLSDGFAQLISLWAPKEEEISAQGIELKNEDIIWVHYDRKKKKEIILGVNTQGMWFCSTAFSVFSTPRLLDILWECKSLGKSTMVSRINFLQKCSDHPLTNPLQSQDKRPIYIVWSDFPSLWELCLHWWLNIVHICFVSNWQHVIFESKSLIMPLTSPVTTFSALYHVQLLVILGCPSFPTSLPFILPVAMSFSSFAG